MRLAWLLAVAVLAACTRAPGVPAPDGAARAGRLVPAAELDAEATDYDPWQPFNEKMFAFNHDVLDRWLVKPLATGWEMIVPRAARQGFARAVDNLDMPRRLVNNLLQLRPLGAGRELARFVVNTKAGVGGVFDIGARLHLEKSDADTGETLALYGVGAGPYLVGGAAARASGWVSGGPSSHSHCSSRSAAARSRSAGSEARP